jgi:mannose-6-phosphate isomerase-like protein (cupin superfamily)
MAKVVIRHSDEVEPTLFIGRQSKRLITPERDDSKLVSVHLIHRYAGLSNEIRYPKNDEVLYILDGEGFVIVGDEKTAIKPGTCIFTPAGETIRLFNVVELKMIAVLSPPRYRNEWKDRKDLIHLEAPIKKINK